MKLHQLSSPSTYFPRSCRTLRLITTSPLIFLLLTLTGTTHTALAQDCSGLPRKHRATDLIKWTRGDGKRKRRFRINTPPKYDPTKKNKLVFLFHSWADDSASYTTGDWGKTWMDESDYHGYVVVAPDALGPNQDYWASWSFLGSTNGLGQNGEVTTCDTEQGGNYCNPSCGNCPNRCGWTQCQDDDVQFVADLIAELPNYVCVDNSRVYAVGIGNGGSLVWNLGQDERTATALAGLGVIVGLPLHDYNIGKATNKKLPVIGMYGTDDLSVPPGSGNMEYSQSLDGEAYRYVPAAKIHATWAKDNGCKVKKVEATNSYDFTSNKYQECFSHCDTTSGEAPYSVDCRVADMGHESYSFNFDAALMFFEHHKGNGPWNYCKDLDNKMDCRWTEGCYWFGTYCNLGSCGLYKTEKNCVTFGCKWKSGVQNCVSK